MHRKKLVVGIVVLLLCSPLLWSQPAGEAAPSRRQAHPAEAGPGLLRAWHSIKIMFR